jgi:hypothetical protein
MYFLFSIYHFGVFHCIPYQVPHCIDPYAEGIKKGAPGLFSLPHLGQEAFRCPLQPGSKVKAESRFSDIGPVMAQSAKGWFSGVKGPSENRIRQGPGHPVSITRFSGLLKSGPE